MTPSRWRGQIIFLGIYLFFFHARVWKDVHAALFTVKHPRSSRIWPPFFNDVVILYTFCGKEKRGDIMAGVKVWWDYCLMWTVLFYRGLFFIYHCMQCFIDSAGRTVLHCCFYVLDWLKGIPNIYLALLFEYALRNVFLWNKIIQLKADGLSPPSWVKAIELFFTEISNPGHLLHIVTLEAISEACARALPCSECRRERVEKEGTFTQSEETCLFVISMMHCASQKGTTVRHKYFGTLDFASSSQFHGQRDNVAFRFGIWWTESGFWTPFLSNWMVRFTTAED